MTSKLLRAHRSVWVSAALVAVIAVDLLHFIVPARHGSAPLPRVPIGRPHQVHQPDLQRILSAHLFGVGPSAANMVPAAGPALKLTGIILMGDSNGGYAMLGEQGKPTRLYRVGADPPGHESLRLHAVYRDRVVMEVAGRLETVRLRMERPSPHVAMMTAASEQLPAGSQGAAPEFPGQTQALVPDAAETAFGELYVDRDAVSDQGMLIHPDKHYQRQFGLHDGDRVTQVDGVQITDPAALDEALRSANGSLSLTITRDGVEQTVSVPVNN